MSTKARLRTLPLAIGLLGAGCVVEHPDWGRSLDAGSTSAPGETSMVATTSGASTSTGSGTTTGGATTTSSGSSSSSSTTDGESSSSTGESPPEDTIFVEPDLFTCSATVSPDPEVCEQDAGPGQIKVDLMDGGSGTEQRGYLTIPLDNQFAGLTITSAILEITVSNNTSAGTDDSGSIYQLDPFAYEDLLSVPLPQPIGGRMVPIAGSQGVVDQRQAVQWAIPVELIVPDTTLHLGLWPNSDNGARYWGLQAAQDVRPRLIVEHEPSE